MIEFKFIYTSVLLVLMTVALFREIIEADLIIFFTLLLLLLGRVVTLQEAFAGFSNHGMLTVAFLFIVAAALQKTGMLNRLGQILLGGKGNISKKLFRFLFPVSAVSAFFNNTPIVAMLIPVIRTWAKKHDYSVSKFLIPLSYAAILGGTCTLIGTSTNLVVHGLMLENGLEGMTFFEISKVGIPMALIGLTAIVFFGHRLLPERKEPMVQLSEKTREFVIAMKVNPDYQHIGKTIEEAGLRHLSGLFLFQIERNNDILTPVGREEKILLNDRLFFTGLPETIMELQRTTGLTLLKDTTLDLKHYDSDTLGSFEVVVSPNSPLIGKNVRESGFRSQYDAVIIAIHRSGERIRKKIGDVVFRAGDTLLVLAKHDFFQRWYYSRDFHLVSKSVEIHSKSRWQSNFSLCVLFGMILCMALGVIPILLAVCLASLLLVVTRCISPQDARNSIEWKIILIIASAFGIAKGIDNSGIAPFLANRLIFLMDSLGILGLLAIIYFITSSYTAVITNNAAAALVFPVALSVARQANLDPRPFLITVAIAASTSFATPIGYQTNLMVYGPGGYRFRDFLKIGIPMNLFIGIIGIALIYTIYY
jgi:di/tricarboxylate transporter